MKPVYIEVSVRVMRDWSAQADAEVQVPIGTDPKLVGQLVADAIPQVIATAREVQAKREAEVAAAEATLTEV
jgi:hypothetical protein